MKLTKIKSTVVSSLLAAFALSPVIAAQTTQPVNKPEDRPVLAEKPSLPGLDQDIATIHSLGLKGDLGAYEAAVDDLSGKWKAKDELSYLCILSEACNDLTGFDFGFRNLTKSHNLSEKYAGDALVHTSDMSLGMEAYFVEHLNYVPGLGIQGVTGADWEALRTARARLWLQTWSDLASRSAEKPTLPLVPPPLPDRKYITTRVIINGGVDPSDISDPTVRDNYDKAWKQYYADHDRIMDQDRLQTVSNFFVQRAKKYLAEAYSLDPKEQDQLIGLMKAYGIPGADQSDILSEIEKRTGVPK